MYEFITRTPPQSPDYEWETQNFPQVLTLGQSHVSEENMEDAM